MKSGQVQVYLAELCKMRQVLQSMRSTVVPPKAHCPERFLCLRDTCHEEVPVGVSFHLLWNCSGLLSPWMLLCDQAEDIYNKKKMALFPLSFHPLRVNTKLTLIENKKGKSLETKLKPLVTFQSTGQFKSLKCGIREDLMRFKLNGGGQRQWRSQLQALFK